MNKVKIPWWVMVFIAVDMIVVGCLEFKLYKKIISSGCCRKN